MHSVLVVDDEPFVRVSLAGLRTWEEDGFEFLREAAHGREALEVLAAYPEIDVVLVDLSMPVMNGIEFLRRLPDFCRDVGRSVPATVVLSATNDFPLVREAFTLGARDYLLKAEVDAERMLDVVLKASEGLADDPRSNLTILQRRHRDLLKQRLLRDLLITSPSVDDAEVLSSLGMSLEPPLVIVVHRILDFEAIQERYGDDGLGQFQSLVRRALTQVLARHGGGELVAMAPHLWVTWWEGQAPTAPRYADDAAAYLDQYLSVRAQGQVVEVPTWDQAWKVWKDLPLDRRIESRIVVVAKRFIREHFADAELGLDQIAGAAGVSKNHLSWEFSRETGETLLGYLTRIRIDQAKVLLADPQCRVLDTAARVGYPNVEHFSRVFKKLTGVSPNKWSDFVVNPAR